MLHRGDGAPPAEDRRRRRETKEPIPGEPSFPGTHCNCGPRRDPLTEGTRPRPVTVDTARRRQLWTEGKLILEDAYGSHEIGEISDDLTATSQPADPTLDGRSFNLLPERTLTFVPSK